jgi:RNA polymerase sigma-70 factor (ECF subfamily)
MQTYDWEEACKAMEATNRQMTLTHESSDSTEALVLRAREKDADAFAKLIGRYERTALAVGYSVLGNGENASDVVQEAFLRAWQRMGELKEPARFATWICGIVRNLAIDQCRRDKHRTLAIDFGGANALAACDQRCSPDPLHELSSREQQQIITKALDSLDEISRPIVVLRYYEGLSSKEIGQILNLSPQAVDMRLSRARQQLREMLAGSNAGS